MGLLYCTAEAYEEPGMDDNLFGMDGLVGPEFGEVLPDKDDVESKEGSDSLLEWEDENRTEDCRGEESAVMRMGDDGTVPLLGRDRVFGVALESSSLSITSSNAGTGTLGMDIVGEELIL
jgi:hypothetical protein